MKSAAKENAFPFVGGLQIPRFNRSNLFFTADCKSAGTPSGRLYGTQIRRDARKSRCLPTRKKTKSRKMTTPSRFSLSRRRRKPKIQASTSRRSSQKIQDWKTNTSNWTDSKNKKKRVCQKSKTHPLFCCFIVFLHRITLS